MLADLRRDAGAGLRLRYGVSNALDGSWSGVWTMLNDDAGLRGEAVLIGNGSDLEGWYDVSTLTPLPPARLEAFADAPTSDGPSCRSPRWRSRATSRMHRSR